jgi:uncharacterized alpha-E superfamily protein
VLARIAESLFWIGRYAERADSTARILDVHSRLMLEDPWVDEDAACRSLLGVMGAAIPPGELTSARVVEQLGFDPTSHGSVVGALSAARENARGAREAISSEMWEALNATWVSLRRTGAGTYRREPYRFYRWIRERCSVLAGLTDSTMSRDEGWLFLTLGRSLERADMTARMLRTNEGGGSSVASWLTLLQSCGAWESYVRTYRGSTSERLSIEFLLLDRLFPRSVFHALKSAEDCLHGLETATGRPPTGRTGIDDDARRVVGRARTRLEYRRSDDLLADLPEVLSMVQRSCTATSDAVSRRYFRHTAAVAWAQGGVA